MQDAHLPNAKAVKHRLLHKNSHLPEHPAGEPGTPQYYAPPAESRPQIPRREAPSQQPFVELPHLTIANHVPKQKRVYPQIHPLSFFILFENICGCNDSS